MGSDQYILHLLKTDKQQGFRLLFDRYYRPMCVFGGKFIHNLDTVEDIVQEILMHIWNCNSFERFSNLKSYLFTSVKNKCISALKKESLLSLNDSELSWEKDLFIQEDQSELLESQICQITNAIEELSPACQEVFKMVALDRLKYREVAADLDISINTVKSQVKKAYRLINAKLSLSSLLIFSFWQHF